MMRVRISPYAFFALIFFVPLSSANAETYSWTDDHSIIHFTDDPGGVPKQFRNKIRKLDDDDNDPDKEFTNRPASKETSVVQDTYGGKSYDQWAKELADREAAMTAVRKHIDENADLIKSSNPNRQVQVQLFAEREELLSKFKELKSEYFQQVEIARKAGLQINIEQ